ncbi:MAG: hypothetical protein FVQ79_12715 [Planctomycetes bacterium]|nr:hypothetical protein [Planctomycetota bacterium]
MAFQVRFAWLDIQGRTKNQTITTTAATIAAALTDVANYVAKFTVISDGGLTDISISVTNADDAFVAGPGTNVDVGATFQMQTPTQGKKIMRLPMIKDALVTGGEVILTDLGVLAWTDLFLTGGVWRLNNANPTFQTAVLKGTLDT